MPLDDSCRKFLVSWKMSLFYYKTVFWPTEINMRNCLLNLIKNVLAAFQCFYLKFLQVIFEGMN